MLSDALVGERCRGRLTLRRAVALSSGASLSPVNQLNSFCLSSWSPLLHTCSHRSAPHAAAGTICAQLPQIRSQTLQASAETMCLQSVWHILGAVWKTNELQPAAGVLWQLGTHMARWVWAT